VVLIVISIDMYPTTGIRRINSMFPSLRDPINKFKQGEMTLMRLPSAPHPLKAGLLSFFDKSFKIIIFAAKKKI
jgi:hypothetical protein